MHWSGSAVASALGIAAGDDVTFTSISTDTRTLEPGSLFVALQGEVHDAHTLLDRAVAAGAVAAVVRDGTAALPGLRLYHVPDTLAALGRLGRARRDRVRGPVVCITGTNGKTGTKEMVSSALATAYPTYATRANRNNLVGVPLTVLEAPDETAALVLECGANERGELRRHREITDPTLAVVTNVSRGHLAGFESLDGVLAEKVSLLDGVADAVVGLEPPALVAAAVAKASRVTTAGLDAEADVHPDRWSLDASGHVLLHHAGRALRVPVPGRHQGDNAMIALAVARNCGVDPADAMDAMGNATLPSGRCQLLQRNGLMLLDDSYNANPASVLAALDTADAMRAGRRLVVVVGSMLELGEVSDSAHVEIAQAILARTPYLIGAVGHFVPAFRSVAPHDRHVVLADDPERLAAELQPRLQGDEFILVKASRGVRLEQLIPQLLPGAEAS